MLGDRGVVRQFGNRLPIRIMNNNYITTHVHEIPDTNIGVALQKMYDEHVVILTKDRENAQRTGKLDTVFSSLHGFMRTGDFRKILFMDPPYDQVACNPVEARRYLESTLRTFVDHGYNFMLAKDIYANTIMSNYKLSAYVTVATIGNKLAIRQIADFEIAWSFDLHVIKNFNDFLDALQVGSRKIGRSEITGCCELVTNSLKRAYLEPNPVWGDCEVQHQWKTAIERELGSSGPDWLRP